MKRLPFLTGYWTQQTEGENWEVYGPKGQHYKVTDGLHCSCPSASHGGHYEGRKCKHLVALDALRFWNSPVANAVLKTG